MPQLTVTVTVPLTVTLEYERVTAEPEDGAGAPALIAHNIEVREIAGLGGYWHFDADTAGELLKNSILNEADDEVQEAARNG